MTLAFHQRSGFTFVELLLCVSLLSVVVVGIHEMFIMASILGDVSTNTSLAVMECRSKLEEIRRSNYDSVQSDYGLGGSEGNTFDLVNLRGKGVITIEAVHPEFLKITVGASFANKNNRIVGEDRNLDGVLEAGEDDNGNGKLDSMAVVTTYLAKRS